MPVTYALPSLCTTAGRVVAHPTKKRAMIARNNEILLTLPPN
jgi:hypothetical protein